MKTEIAIIGNGILGSTLAFFLKQHEPSIDVTLIGREEMSGSATMAAGAMLSSWGELGYNHLENEYTREKFKLATKAKLLWEPFCDALNKYQEIPLKVNWGTYLALNKKSSIMEARQLEYIEQRLMESNETFKVCNPDDVPWFRPSKTGESLRLLEVNDGWICSKSVIAALRVACNVEKVTGLNCNVVKIEKQKPSLLGRRKSSIKLHLDNSEIIEAQEVVFANGAFAQKLIDEIEELRRITPRILFGAGAALDITMPDWVKEYGGIDPKISEMDRVFRTLDRGGACGFHAIPKGNWNYYVGASSGVWMDYEKHPRMAGIEALILSTINELSEAFFFSNIQLLGNGFRPVSIDCFPLLGVSEVSPFWFANGTKRDGFTMAPYIMDELAKSMLGLENDLPEIFKPNRPLISYFNKEQAILEAKHMMFGADAQHGGNYPPYLSESINKSREDWAEQVYNKREIEDFGIHPEVLHLYDNDAFYEKIKHGL